MRACPFCGVVDETNKEPYLRVETTGSRDINEEDNGRTFAFLECIVCLSRGPVVIEETKEKAIESAKQMWNKEKSDSAWYK